MPANKTHNLKPICQSVINVVDNISDVAQAAADDIRLYILVEKACISSRMR